MSGSPYCYVDRSGLLQARPGCPFTITHDLIPEAWTQEFIVPWLTILHSNAGPRRTHGSALRDYMARTDINIECHTNVETEPDGRGLFRQIMPFNRRADCNSKANAWTADGQRRGAISFETQDNGGPTLANTPWTGGQLVAIIHASAALNEAYGIPPHHCSGPFARGIDGHAKFADWSIYVGKTCPGAARFAQIPYIHAEVAAMIAGPTPEPIEDDDEMSSLRRYKDRRYTNQFLYPDGTQLSGELAASYSDVPLIESTHDQTLKSLLHRNGLTEADLVREG
jgi:hypothetical protein